MYSDIQMQQECTWSQCQDKDEQEQDPSGILEVNSLGGKSTEWKMDILSKFV